MAEFQVGAEALAWIDLDAENRRVRHQSVVNVIYGCGPFSATIRLGVLVPGGVNG